MSWLSKVESKKEYHDIIFENEQDLLTRGTQLFQTIISKNNLNITNTLVKETFDSMQRKPFKVKALLINKFNKTFQELRDVPARTGVLWSYKDDYQTDLKNAFQKIFQIDITNYGIISKYRKTHSLLNDIVINEPHKDVDTYKHYKKHYSIVQYANNGLSLSWDTGPIFYYRKNFLCNELRLKLYNNLLPLIKNCNDCIYPNAERKDAKPAQRIVSIWDGLQLYGGSDNEQVENIKSAAENINENEYKYNDICIKHIADPLLNNFGHKYWIPSLIQIDDKKCKFITEIPNLSRLKYPRLYETIECVFVKIMPKIEWIIGTKLRRKCIQVIIDIQHYIVKQNTKYAGSWHREGFENSEYVSCGAVYYFNKSDNFHKDIFEIKSKGYKNCSGSYAAEYKIDIDENDLIVFDNESMIHRLNELITMKHDHDCMSYRSHILFLIPKYRINSMRDFNVNGHYAYPYILGYWFLNNIPNDIRELMLKYLDAYDCDLQQMISKRNEVRKSRVNVGKYMNIDLGANN